MEASRPVSPERGAQSEQARRAGMKEGYARSIAQTYCIVGGLVLIGVGILGFIFAGDSFDTGDNIRGENFLIFEVNGWHNVVHIATGAFLLLAGMTAVSAAIGALIFGIAYVAVSVWGFIDGDSLANAVVIDNADNWLHVALAATAIFAAIVSGALGTSARNERREAGV